MEDTISSQPFRPGLHSHNLRRHAPRAAKTSTALTRLRLLLLLIGVGGLGYFAYTWADQQLAQSYDNWAFDHHLSSGANVDNSATPPPEGSDIGRVEIRRLDLSAMVRQGVSDQTLKQAVGHVPSTAMPGKEGNFAIAAHRDTLFRALKDVKMGDIIVFETQGHEYHYSVAATRVVKPSDVSILRPDGGGLIQPGDGPAPAKLMTLITCYPFYYVGPAPERYVVEAKLVENAPPMLNSK